MNLPPEIVENIMCYMDGKTFTHSRRVSKQWLHIADRLSRSTSLWRDFCYREFRNVWPSVYNNGRLSWFHAYRNIIRWQQIKQADTEFSYNTTDDGVILNFSVTRDGDLYIVNGEEVIRGRVDDVSANEVFFTGRYSSYKRNEYLKILGRSGHFIIHSATHPDKSIQIDNILLWQLVGDTLYYVSCTQKLSMCRSHAPSMDVQVTLLGAYYDSDRLLHMHVHHEAVYLVSETGKLLQYGGRKLVLLDTIHMPDGYRTVYMFQGKNILVSAEHSVHIYLENHAAAKLNVKYVTSMLVHGNLLILGTHLGHILVYVLSSLEAMLHLELPDVKYISRASCRSAIFALSVWEHQDQQAILAATNDHVLAIKHRRHHCCATSKDELFIHNTNVKDTASFPVMVHQMSYF